MSDRPYLGSVAGRGETEQRQLLERSLGRINAPPDRMDRLKGLLQREAQMLTLVGQVTARVRRSSAACARSSRTRATSTMAAPDSKNPPQDEARLTAMAATTGFLTGSALVTAIFNGAGRTAFDVGLCAGKTAFA
jgi:hypothetical protein